ncbi:MAG: hypothetical protein IIT77_02660 [Oscillospiraceae bacterium]|nr:hypothetical protein [Oscillospiraceae bacterium]
MQKSGKVRKQTKESQKFAEKHSKLLATNPTEEQLLKLNTEGKKLEEKNAKQNLKAHQNLEKSVKNVTKAEENLEKAKKEMEKYK